MPTASTTLGWTLANWGSAPATWTSSSCSQPSQIYYADNDIPSIPAMFESCPATTLDDCGPRPTNSDLVDDFLSDQRNIPYWSPGVRCPSGWTSVGAASRPSDGQVSTTGIFTVDALPTGTWSDDDNGDIALGAQGALGALLDPSETAIACCPSSMSVGRNGVCYSTLPSHSMSTACFADFGTRDPDLERVSTTFVLFGVTHTGNILVPTVTVPRTPTRTTTRTLDARETEELVAATLAGPIYLVHRPRDGDGNGDGNGNGNDNENNNDSDSSNSDNDSGDSGSDQDNGASRMAMAGILALSLLAGMALVPW